MLQQFHPTILGVLVGFIDSSYATIFRNLVRILLPDNEETLQSFVQLKLFLSRILLSTIFTYSFTPIDGFLDDNILNGIFSIIIALCLWQPTLKILDLGGIFVRNVIAPNISETQEELNDKWKGASWDIAENYSSLSTILFLVFCYSFLIPFILLFSSVTFFLVFFVDKYQLFRKWRKVSSINGDLSIRLRKQVIICVTAHMFVTLRFIYSWPMDSAIKIGDETFRYVSKFPSINIWQYKIQDWQTSDQQKMLQIYKICTFLILSIAIFYVFVLPFLVEIKKLLFYHLKFVGSGQGIPFSSVQRIPVYIPIVQKCFICSHLIDVLPHHMPEFFRPDENEFDLYTSLS
jgi:hypothetical protein